MHFPYRRLQQPKAVLRSRNSNFRLRLHLQVQTPNVLDPDPAPTSKNFWLRLQNDVVN